MSPAPPRLSASLALWAGVAPILAERYTVVCTGLRGYGDSTKPKGAADRPPGGVPDARPVGLRTLYHQCFDMGALWGERCSDLRTETLPGAHFPSLIGTSRSAGTGVPHRGHSPVRNANLLWGRPRLVLAFLTVVIAR